jgi:NitT/TauT family transport system permease protein/putative hydroxymethylpyrimidine transport system permease protein
MSSGATSYRYAGISRPGRRWILPTLLLVALIGAWQLAASTGALADALGLESFLVPSPAEIAESLWQSRELLAENAWVTLREMLLGLGLALVIGVCFAFLMHLSGLIKDTFNPLIVASQTIPILVIAPILVIWFGFGIWPKAAVIALICFFPITISTLAGLGSTDPEAAKMMRTLNASRGQILWRVETPTALPQFFTGARLAVVLAPIGAIFGEWVGASSGLGHLILQDNAQIETARIFATVTILSAMALILFALVAFAERRIVTWR